MLFSPPSSLSSLSSRFSHLNPQRRSLDQFRYSVSLSFVGALPNATCHNAHSQLTLYLSSLSRIPGGGVGMFNGCNAQFNTSPSIWGAQYGGVSSRRDCDALPKSIRKGESRSIMTLFLVYRLISDSFCLSSSFTSC